MPDPLQRVLALVAGVLTLPLMAALSLAVKLDSPGPALFGSRRVGAGGRSFVCFKLRTMAWRRPEDDPRITRAGDPRVTRLGRLLRRARLDELPQLWNVARGEMRLVGPRPEDPAFVDPSQALHREVFAARPGLTGLTQLFHADEAARVDPADPDAHYREAILPAKLRIDAAYLRHRSVALDVWILVQTPRALLGRPLHLPPELAAELPELAGAPGSGAAA